LGWGTMVDEDRLKGKACASSSSVLRRKGGRRKWKGILLREGRVILGRPGKVHVTVVIKG